METNKYEPWQKKVNGDCLQFVGELENGFDMIIRKTRNDLPKKPNPSAGEVDDSVIYMLNTYLSTFVGGMCAILSKYFSPDEEFEEIVVKLVKDKFTQLRKVRIISK